MTRARFTREGEKYEIDVQGHSGFNREGPDIVCAACSVLCGALLQAVMTFAAQGKAKIHGAKPPKEGSFFLCFEAKDPACAACVFTIWQGFLLLENSYEKFVEVSPEVGRNEVDPNG